MPGDHAAARRSENITNEKKICQMDDLGGRTRSITVAPQIRAEARQ
jgi:hypothetical protein